MIGQKVFTRITCLSAGVFSFLVAGYIPAAFPQLNEDNANKVFHVVGAFVGDQCAKTWQEANFISYNACFYAYSISYRLEDAIVDIKACGEEIEAGIFIDAVPCIRQKFFSRYSTATKF